MPPCLRYYGRNGADTASATHAISRLRIGAHRSGGVAVAGLRFKVGLAEAARLAGKQRSTILRAIQSGRLTDHRDSHGRRRVDVAELERVYGPLRTTVASDVAPQPANRAHGPTPEALAAALVDELRAELQRERDRADRLEADAREWQQRYVKLADRVLLEDKRPDRPAPVSPPSPATSSTPPPTRDEYAQDEDTFARRVEDAGRWLLGGLPDIIVGGRRRRP